MRNSINPRQEECAIASETMEIAVKPEIKQGGTPQPQQPPQGGIEDGGAVVGGAGSNASGNSGKQFPQGGNRRGNNAGGRGGRGGQNRFGGGGGGQRGAGNNQNFRGNRQNQSEVRFITFLLYSAARSKNRYALFVRFKMADSLHWCEMRPYNNTHINIIGK